MVETMTRTGWWWRITAVISACLLYFHSEAGAASVGWSFVVDDGDAGYSETGNAWVSRVYAEAYNGDYRYLSHKEHTTTRKGTANWQISIPASGIYRVDIHYRPTENRTTDADYHVYDGDGIIHRYSIDQTYDGHLSSVGWYTLGNYAWNRGHTAKVVLDGTDDTQSDEADAVRWVLIEKNVGVSAGGDYLVPLIAKVLLVNKTGSTTAVPTSVNFSGSWLETGGFNHCQQKTELGVIFTYSGGNYQVEKAGTLENDDCTTQLLPYWSKSLSPGNTVVNAAEFTKMMSEIFSSATVSTLVFTGDRIVYEIDNPSTGIQTRTMERR